MLTANQIQFVNKVVDYLTQSGWMSAAQLYESPFTDSSPRGVEGVAMFHHLARAFLKAYTIPVGIILKEASVLWRLLPPSR